MTAIHVVHVGNGDVELFCRTCGLIIAELQEFTIDLDLLTTTTLAARLLTHDAEHDASKANNLSR